MVVAEPTVLSVAPAMAFVRVLLLGRRFGQPVGQATCYCGEGEVVAEKDQAVAEREEALAGKQEAVEKMLPLEMEDTERKPVRQAHPYARPHTLTETGRHREETSPAGTVHNTIHNTVHIGREDGSEWPQSFRLTA